MSKTDKILPLCVGFAAVALIAVGSTAAVARSSSGHRSARRPHPETDVALTHFTAQWAGVSFDYPAQWNARTSPLASGSFSTLITYLAPVPLAEPCIDDRTATGEEISCTWPVKTLKANSLLVSWSNVGYPHEGPEVPDPNTTIGGQLSRITVATPGVCKEIGATETLTADIPRPAGSHYEMLACLRGPDTTANISRVKAMLASVRVVN